MVEKNPKSFEWNVIALYVYIITGLSQKTTRFHGSNHGVRSWLGPIRCTGALFRLQSWRFTNVCQLDTAYVEWFVAKQWRAVTLLPYLDFV